MEPSGGANEELLLSYHLTYPGQLLCGESVHLDEGNAIR